MIVERPPRGVINVTTTNNNNKEANYDIPLSCMKGTMDGWFPRTEMPGNQVNQTDYFSGHYQAFGLNVQAMCDPDLLFLYIAVASPGKINDSRAFSRLRELQNWM